MANLNEIRIDEQLPEQTRDTSIVQQFLYNAALWNAHRIHYDTPWATEVEGYPELVVAGPLMGDWMTQCVLNWLGDAGRLTSVEYSNRRAAYVGETLRVAGRVTHVDLPSRQVQVALTVSNADGEVVAPGSATVEFSQP